MLVVTPLSVAAVDYFFDGTHAGRWDGAGIASLALEGEVVRRDFHRLLGGRAPGGERLVRAVAHRRAGWDLTFAAPKSVSLLAALGGTRAASLGSAHVAAVDDALGWLAEHGCRIGRGDGAVPAGPVIARFEHSTSDGDDPHVHTHAVLVNVARSAAGWAPLASSPLWPTLRPLGPIYRLALRARIDAVHPGLRWRRSPDGLTELAGVPRSAIEAVSGRTADVTAALERWDDVELARRPVRRAVRAVTRGAAAPTRGWEQRAADSGLDRSLATALLDASPVRPGPDGPPDPAPSAADLAGWLAGRCATFTTLDVARAVAVLHGDGLHPSAVDRQVASFLADPAPWTPGRRWTTTVAVGADRRLLATSGERHRRGVSKPLAEARIAEHALPGDLADQAARLVAQPERTALLPGTPGKSRLIAQAAVLAAARACWEAAGWSVALAATTSPGAARRWDALAGLRLATHGRQPDVMVVDRADRLAIADLQALVDRAVRDDQRVILVEGGSLPARHHPASTVFDALRRPHLAWPHLAEPHLAEPHLAGPPLGGPPLSDARATSPDLTGPDLSSDDLARHVPVTAGVAGLTAAGVGTLDAFAGLVGRWAATPAAARPLLIGLGPAEVEALNAAARRHLTHAGALEGPALRAAGRDFQAGDRVVALRVLHRRPAGTIGTVATVGRDGRAMSVAWGGDLTALDRHDARQVGHAYALTLARAVKVAGPSLLLGDPRSVPHLEDLLGASVASTGRAPQRTDRLDDLASRVGGGPVADASATRSLVDRPLAELVGRRRALAAQLWASGPPGHPGGGDPESDRWIDCHAGELAEHRALGRAAHLRGDAEARTAGADLGVRRTPPTRARPQVRDLGWSL